MKHAQEIEQSSTLTLLSGPATKYSFSMEMTQGSLRSRRSGMRSVIFPIQPKTHTTNTQTHTHAHTFFKGKNKTKEIYKDKKHHSHSIFQIKIY